MVGDNKESLKGKGVFFGSSVGGWWFVGILGVGGVWACWIWGGVEACFLPFLRCRLCGVSKGACGDRCLALPLRYALSRYSGRTRRRLEVGVLGSVFGFAPSIRALALLREG